MLALSKEDERSAALARRAQQGDYDEGEKVERVNTGNSFADALRVQTSFSNSLLATGSFWETRVFKSSVHRL